MHSIEWFWTTGIHDPAWVQAFAAVVLVVLTIVTLAVLSIYTRDTHTLAKISFDQMQAMVGKERARLYVAIDRSNVCHVQFDSAQVTPPVTRQDIPKLIGRHKLKLCNAGPTPAVNVSVRYTAITAPFGSVSSGDTLFEITKEMIPATLESDVFLELGCGFVYGMGLPETFHINVWGEVTYSDVISQISRSTRFRFRIPMQMRGGLIATQNGEWEDFGEPEDNRAT